MRPSAPLSEAHRNFLAPYEAVRAALAADDLAAAKEAAAAISGDAANATAKADSLPVAREAFRALSRQALEIARGQPGYYQAHCPMVPANQGNWVQTTKIISNPYFGKSMAKCGTIRD